MGPMGIDTSVDSRDFWPRSFHVMVCAATKRSYTSKIHVYDIYGTGNSLRDCRSRHDSLVFAVLYGMIPKFETS